MSQDEGGPSNLSRAGLPCRWDSYTYAPLSLSAVRHDVDCSVVIETAVISRVYMLFLDYAAPQLDAVERVVNLCFWTET